MRTWILTHINSILAVILAAFAPVIPLLLTVGCLITIDFIFGIFRAYKKNEEITSRKMSATIGKILLYNLMVLSVFFLDHFILKTGMNLEKIAASLIGIVEIKSISETFKTLTGIDMWDKIKGLVDRGESHTKNNEE